MLQEGIPPEDALSATQPAASFADEGFALCRRHSEVAKGTMSICGRGRRENRFRPRNALCFFPRTPFCSLRKAFHALCRYQSSRRRLRYQAPPMGGGARRPNRLYRLGASCARCGCHLRRDLRWHGTSAHARALQRPCPCSHDASARLRRELAAAALARGEVLPLRGQNDRRGLLLGHGARLCRDGALRRGQLFGHVLRDRGACPCGARGRHEGQHVRGTGGLRGEALRGVPHLRSDGGPRARLARGGRRAHPHRLQHPFRVSVHRDGLPRHPGHRARHRLTPAYPPV